MNPNKDIKHINEAILAETSATMLITSKCKYSGVSKIPSSILNFSGVVLVC